MKLNGCIRRMDSIMIESNIRFLSRMELIYTCISKLVVYLTKKVPDMIPEHLMHYADLNDYNRIFYHQRNDGMEAIIQALLADSDCLLGMCRTDFEEVTDYQFDKNAHTDSRFLQEALSQMEKSKEEIILVTDGGYDGQDNVAIAKEKNVRLITTALIGKEAPDALADFEFSNLARLRNEVETIPANIRKNYHLDKLPRGKQRGKFFFGSKIAALNFRKLFGFRKGLGNYVKNPVLAELFIYGEGEGKEEGVYCFRRCFIGSI